MMSSRNHQIMSGRLHIWSGCLSLARRPVFISFLMCHRVWQSHHKKTKLFCKTKKCQKIWQIIFSVYNYIVKLKRRFYSLWKNTWKQKSKVVKYYATKENHFGLIIYKNPTFSKERKFWENEKKQRKKCWKCNPKLLNFYLMN